ncbi:MAG: S-layer homology domain-containing protein [Clostridiaceae bacterium]|nr:S-layer homology domain-containing protein [Clostridiaceae bacterium]
MMKKIISMAICLIVVMTGMVYAESGTAAAIEAPKDLTVELIHSDEGYPYFRLKMQVPATVQVLGDNITEDEGALFYEVEYKVGNEDWRPAGAIEYAIGPVFEMTPEDMGIGENVDIKANVYQFRVKFGYYTFEEADEYGNRIAKEPIFSPFSNIASIGIAAYQKTYEGASTWAIPELDKAEEYGFITEKIKDNMSQPITREELCEVIMKLYEKMVGHAEYSDPSTFSDTKNPEIYKAYGLGIVKGVGNDKFAPNDLTNREQVAAMLYRAAKVIKPEADFSIDGAEKFKDDNLISSWAIEAVKFMNKNGLIKGSDGYVNPKGTTTREQAVLIIVRIYEKYTYK